MIWTWNFSTLLLYLIKLINKRQCVSIIWNFEMFLEIRSPPSRKNYHYYRYSSAEVNLASCRDCTWIFKPRWSTINMVQWLKLREGVLWWLKAGLQSFCFFVTAFEQTMIVLWLRGWNNWACSCSKCSIKGPYPRAKGESCCICGWGTINYKVCLTVRTMTSKVWYMQILCCEERYCIRRL